MKPNLKEIYKYKIVNKLKEIERLNSAGKRKESTAEHTWGTLILADYYLNKMNLNLNRTKIYELLMYHDLVEIHSGDIPLHPKINANHKNTEEKKSAEKLREQLPKEISEKFYLLFNELENLNTQESKFCKAIDALEAQINEIDYKEDWKGWTKQFLLEKKLKYFEDFPEMKQDFIYLCEHLEEEGYFSQ